MGLALTSGCSVDVDTHLPETPPPPSALLLTPLLVPLSPSSQPSLPLLPHAWGPMEVNYLSVNRLVMTMRQGASGPWH